MRRRLATYEVEFAVLGLLSNCNSRWVALRPLAWLPLLVGMLASASAAHADCDFHGQAVREGQGIPAFKDAFVPLGKSCETQTRTCRGGKLAGGYFHPTCTPVPSVKAKDSGPFKRSDVMFTVRLVKHYYYQPWFDLLNRFGANRIVWTYAGEELLQDPRVTGKLPVQCALEYWVPPDHPQRDEMSCTLKAADGSISGYAQHPVFKTRIPDTNTKAWRDYAYTNAKNLVFLGCSSFVQDVPAIMAVTRNTKSFIKDGCHSSESEALYKYYKSSHPAASYPDFMKYSVNQYHDWLHQNIRTAAKNYDPGNTIYFSGNTSAAVPAHLDEDAWFFPKFDFLQAEVFGDYSHNNPSKTIAELVRYLNVKNSGIHPVVLTLRSDTARSDNVSFLRKSTMSTYSFGMVPMIPWTASAMSDNPLNYFFGDPRDFSDIYKLVRASTRLFDDYKVPENDQMIAPGESVNAGRSIKTSTQSILITSRSSMAGNSKALYVVNWGAGSGQVTIDLKKSDFPRRPDMMLRLGDPKPVAAEAQEAGEYYRYSFDALPEWLILFDGN